MIGADTSAEAPPASKQAFDFAHDMWQIPDVGEDIHKPQESNTSPEDVEKAIAAAQASRKNDFQTMTSNSR